jgi:hypothetical protein
MNVIKILCICHFLNNVCFAIKGKLIRSKCCFGVCAFQDPTLSSNQKTVSFSVFLRLQHEKKKSKNIILCTSSASLVPEYVLTVITDSFLNLHLMWVHTFLFPCYADHVSTYVFFSTYTILANYDDVTPAALAAA